MLSLPTDYCMPQNGDGVDINEYVIAMLEMLELVEKQKVEKLRRQFRNHDKDGSGMLDADDLREIARENHERAEKRMHAVRGEGGLPDRMTADHSGQNVQIAAADTDMV